MAPILSVGKPDVSTKNAKWADHLCGIPDTTKDEPRELEVLLAVHHRPVPE